MRAEFPEVACRTPQPQEHPGWRETVARTSAAPRRRSAHRHRTLRACPPWRKHPTAPSLRRPSLHRRAALFAPRLLLAHTPACSSNPPAELWCLIHASASRARSFEVFPKSCRTTTRGYRREAAAICRLHVGRSMAQQFGRWSASTGNTPHTALPKHRPCSLAASRSRKRSRADHSANDMAGKASLQREHKYPSRMP